MTASSSPTMTALGSRAHELYERLRPEIEITENIGKLIVMDVESGDYQIDDNGIESSRRLQSRQPNSALYALRLGYKAVETLGGILERTEELRLATSIPCFCFQSLLLRNKTATA